MKIFISGPMTGYPKYNFPEFDAWEKRLAAAGHEVVNPTHISRSYKKEEVLDHGEKFLEMQQRQLDALKTCDTIFLLNGWENSNGAKLELKAALELNRNVVLQDNSLEELDAGTEEQMMWCQIAYPYVH